MEPYSKLLLWSLIFAFAWVWMIVSDWRSGQLGWSFARLRRSDRPKLFWFVFAAQHCLMLLCFVTLADTILA